MKNNVILLKKKQIKIRYKMKNKCKLSQYKFNRCKYNKYDC